MQKLINNIKLKDILSYWPIIILWPTILGYIGFYTFASENGITVPQVDTSTIIGIGIYNMIASILLYNPRRKRNEPSIRLALFTYGYLNLLTLNPFLIILLITIDLQIWSILKNRKDDIHLKDKVKMPLSKLRDKVNLHNKILFITDIVIIIGVFLISLFYNHIYIFVLMFINLLMELFHYLKSKTRHKYLNLIMVTFIVPVFTSMYYFNDIEYTIFGLSKERAVIELKDNTKITVDVVYRSSNFIYTSDDSTKTQIPIAEIKKITKLQHVLKTKSGIDLIKSWVYK